MLSSIIFRIITLFIGTLYPAYTSYKAVKYKNMKEYRKWMMYWITYAFFTCAEIFTDALLSWFPFYYQTKTIVVLCLSLTTNGSGILYKKFVQPILSSREQEIDEYILKIKEQSYKRVVDLGISVFIKTALSYINPSAFLAPPSLQQVRQIDSEEMSADEDMGSKKNITKTKSEPGKPKPVIKKSKRKSVKNESNEIYMTKVHS